MHIAAGALLARETFDSSGAMRVSPRFPA